MNTINVIRPYKYNGMWVFDDQSVGLIKEPFVAGADKIIELMVSGLNGPENGFNLIFSEREFPGCFGYMEWRREESGGNWYYSGKVDMEGWLCPALFKYFEKAPARIYYQIQP